MSRGTDASKVNVPDDLRDLLLEFTISYLIEQPPDIIDYAVDFFTKLQHNRRTNPPRRNAPVSPDDSIISNEEERTQESAGAVTRINIPAGLHEILLDFTVCCLRERPPDRVDYAAKYFLSKKKLSKTQCVSCPNPSSSSQKDSQDEEPPVGRFSFRRKSVFAEQYDPENDDDEETAKVVFPKSDAQRSRLADSVKNILLFRALDKEQMTEVLDAMFEKVVSEGDYIIRQGDDGDNFYVIEKGTYHAFVSDGKEMKKVHTYENSGSFGELALLYNMPRAATVQAGSDGALWAMDRQTFRRIVLKSAFRKRKMYEKLIDCVPMLKSLQPYERMNLADALLPRTYADGDRIIEQGDSADGMYFVEEGTVRITIQNEKNSQVEINTVQKGGYFGELALVTHKPRAASVYAVGKVKLAFLDVEAFERLLGPCMELMKRNIDDYEDQLVRIFGSKNNITDIR